MKFAQLKNIAYFSWKIIHQNLFEQISGSPVWNVKQFVFVVQPREGLPKYIKTKYTKNNN